MKMTELLSLKELPFIPRYSLDKNLHRNLSREDSSNEGSKCVFTFRNIKKLSLNYHQNSTLPAALALLEQARLCGVILLLIQVVYASELGVV